MNSLRIACPLRVLAPAAVLLAVGAGRVAAGELSFEQRIAVTGEVLYAGSGASAQLGKVEIEFVPGSSGAAELRLTWPVSEPQARLRVEVSGTPGDDEDDLHLRLACTLRFAGSRPVVTRRDLWVREASTSLIDVFTRDRERLVLSLRAEKRLEPTVKLLPNVGAPVQFRLVTEYVRGEQATQLQSNEIYSLVGEPVEYSLDLGEADTPQSVRLILTPLRITGDIVELRVEISGTLPGDEAPLVIQRSQTLVTSRGATSSVAVTAGNPPAGYRFRITPEF